VLGGIIYRWLLLFQEYDFEIVVKPRRMKKGPEHLSRLEHGEEPTSLEDTLPDAQLLAIRKVDDHFVEIVWFLSTRMAPLEYIVTQKKQLVVRAADFSRIVGQLYKMGPYEVVYVTEGGAAHLKTFNGEWKEGLVNGSWLKLYYDNQLPHSAQ
jgi:hypothetical protein